MNLIYSGFDTIEFAIKGAASPAALTYLELCKEAAIKEQSDMPVSFANGALTGLIAQTGAKGGYAYLLRLGGDLGHIVKLKKNFGRNEWNAHVKIRALALAVYGWEEALARVFYDLATIGFYENGVSLSRVDYAMDFLNAGILLNPQHFVAHSRVKKSAYKIELNAYSRGQICESVTLGKMPNRQVIVYDKRREVIEKRKHAWFEIWGIDRADLTQTIHRVEIRLGKSELKRKEIQTIDDLRTRVNVVMSHAVNVVRYVKPRVDDQNISRWPNYPIWDKVQSHIKDHLLKQPNYVEPERVKQVIREQKALESKKLVLGNMANLAVFEGMPIDNIKNHMVKLVEVQFSEIQANDEHPFWKSYTKTLDRFTFLDRG